MPASNSSLSQSFKFVCITTPNKLAGSETFSEISHNCLFSWLIQAKLFHSKTRHVINFMNTLSSAQALLLPNIVPFACFTAFWQIKLLSVCLYSEQKADAIESPSGLSYCFENTFLTSWPCLLASIIVPLFAYR